MLTVLLWYRVSCWILRSGIKPKAPDKAIVLNVAPVSRLKCVINYPELTRSNSENMSCHQTCNFKYILVIYIYCEYFLLYNWQIAIHSNIYWGDTNDRQQAITQLMSTKGLGHGLSKHYKRILKCFFIWHDNNQQPFSSHGIQQGDQKWTGFEISARYLHLIRKLLWNYEGLITICDITPLNG